MGTGVRLREKSLDTGAFFWKMRLVCTIISSSMEMLRSELVLESEVELSFL